MFNINKIKSYLFKKIIRIQLENFLKVASAQIPSGSFVLDFASSANKYSYIFEHTIYHGADIELPKNIILNQNQFFTRADLNFNPFRSDIFDVVVCTNSIDYVSSNLDKTKEAFENLLRNLKNDGSYITMHNSEWIYAKNYRQWILENFKDVKCYTYNGILNRKINNLYLTLNKINDLWLKRILSISFYSLIFIFRSILINLDKLLYFTHDCFFYVAKNKINKSSKKTNISEKYSDIFISIKNKKPLSKIELNEVHKLTLNFIVKKYNCEISEVNFLYGDSENIYPVINNIVRITKEDEINLKDI